MKSCFVAAAGAALLVAACSPTAPTQVAAGSPPSTAAAPVDDVGVTLHSVKTATRVGSPYAPEKPADGAILVIVSYGVKNQSTKPLTFTELPDVHLQDPSGVSYNADSAKTLAAALNDRRQILRIDDLNPGLTLQKKAVFEVSKAAFDPKTWFITVAGADAKTPISEVGSPS